MPFLEFLILQAVTPFLKATKPLSLTFYLYLTYMCISREKKLDNINNLIADIQKLKRLEKRNALTNSKKTITF